MQALFTGSLSIATPQTVNAQTKIPALQQNKAVQQKNVIFILTDDHRNDFMGFTGKLPWLKTLSLNALAKGGAHFKNTFVTISLCSPNRASILTGQYSHVHTVVDDIAPEPADLILFPQSL